MADFVESEAEVSENDYTDEEEAASQKKKKKKMMISDDDDDEDEVGLDEDLKDLIDDNPVEEEPDEDSEEEGGDGEKRKHRDSDLEEDLSEDDYDLIEENLGIKIGRKTKRKRIRVMSDEDSDKEGDQEQNERDEIERELFEGEGEEEMQQQEEREELPDTLQEDLAGSGEESDEEDNFIVDEDDRPIGKQKKKKKHIHDDVALQEAQDIFGVDFDFDEFEHYGEYDDEEEEEEDEYEDEEGEGEAAPRQRKGQKKRTTKTTIFEVFEPSELERGHFTDMDQEIRVSDMPERFQLRRIPICAADDPEIKEEAQWIFKHAFTTAPLSQQDYYDGGVDPVEGRPKRPQSTVGKICDALNFMRNQQFEVPFIAFYRKEYVEPELNINDLWKIYRWDEKWMQLRNRRQALVTLFEKMQQFQFEQIDPDKPLESHIRTLTEDDLDRVKMVTSMEELKDVYQHFLLYYGSDIPKMKNAIKKKKKKEKRQKPINVENGEEEENAENPEAQVEPEEEEEEEEEEQQETLKQATRKSGYNICAQAGLADLARKFGLTPEQFGQNLRDNYQRYDVEQDPTEPNDLATEFINNQFRTEEDVLKGAVHMVAMQLAHEPLVRQAVRTVFQERGKITARANKKGLKEIDESHPCYSLRFLKNKPLNTLAYDQFLKLDQAKADGMLTYEIHLDDKPDPTSSISLQTYFEEMKPLYHRDEFSHLVQEWNNLRSQALERAFTQVLYPQMIKELTNKLLDESREHIVRACCLKLYNWLKVAPYQVDQQLEDDDDDYDTSKGIRVLGIGISRERDEPAFCALVDGDGEVTDFLRLVHIMKHKKSFRKEDREGKEADMEKLKDFIATKKPHVIAVAAECRDALTVIEDVQQVVNELEQEQQIAPINIELLDNELAVVYMNSKKSEQDFREYPPLLRQAVSLARRLQDPLIEFCQLCNPDEDILALKFHTLQDVVTKEELLEALYLEFINRVNEVGVDVNRCVNNSHTALLVQFVCGLGPRKGFHLLRILKQNNSRLENRTQLVTMCHMGPKVFINCAGFIKIDTNSLGESTDTYVEVLDGSRVHPETYEWARKMAVDALEYDDTSDDANPAGALDEILESPERLKDLDLDAFAEELERQGYGNKHITLYDIRAELNHRYKDLRTPYRPPTQEEKFNMLTKETPTTFYIGKLIQCRVTGFAYRRPRGEQLEEGNPRKNDETGLWQCPFCQKSDFPEISDVWNHFDARDCPGQAMGVKIRLDNSCTGYIPIRFLSDSHVTNPEDRVKINMQLHCRVMKIDIARFSVDLTSRSSDLSDKDGKWKLAKDVHYDQDTEDADMKLESDKKKNKAKQSYVTRVIAHPSFKNIDFRSCEKLMANMEQGDVIIRPSSKGSDHLTVTWKVTDGIMQHVDVREEGKENAFSLGSSLWIDTQEFEDLDEIIARYIQPMAAFARDILNYKYYQDADGGKKEILDKFLVDEKKKAPSKIPYILCASTQYPGKFMLGYLPRKPTIYEFVTVTPEGVRYRGQVFHSLNSLVRWFKDHFRDPIPGTPASMRTPLGMTSQVNQTPNVSLGKLDSAAIQRAAAGLPSSVYSTLQQVAGQTPGFPSQGFNYGSSYNFQATPVVQPMLTPQYGVNTTPSQHVGTTPNQAMGTPTYNPTPRGQWPGSTPSGMTPRHQPGGLTPQHRSSGGMTPQHRSGGMTPQHRSGGMTPQHRSGSLTPRHHPGGMTPQHKPSGMTPRHQPGGMTPQHRSGGSTPRHQPGGSTPRSTPRASASKPAVTDWAKAAEMWRKQMESGNRTPAKSPMAGDATPLFDEL